MGHVTAFRLDLGLAVAPGIWRVLRLLDTEGTCAGVFWVPSEVTAHLADS